MVYLHNTGESAAILDGSPGKEIVSMPVSKAQQASVNKYVKANYDRINVTLPKGEKEVIQGYAAATGESVNGFIVRAVRERIERDSGGTASEIAGKDSESTQGAGVVSFAGGRSTGF